MTPSGPHTYLPTLNHRDHNPVANGRTGCYWEELTLQNKWRVTRRHGFEVKTPFFFILFTYNQVFLVSFSNIYWTMTDSNPIHNDAGSQDRLRWIIWLALESMNHLFNTEAPHGNFLSIHKCLPSNRIYLFFISTVLFYLCRVLSFKKWRGFQICRKIFSSVLKWGEV